MVASGRLHPCGAQLMTRGASVAAPRDNAETPLLTRAVGGSADLRARFVVAPGFVDQTSLYRGAALATRDRLGFRGTFRDDRN